MKGMLHTLNKILVTNLFSKYTTAMSFEIGGKVALVTGGTSGLGYEIVKTFLQNGAKGVAIVATNESRGLEVQEQFNGEFKNSKCIFIKADVSEEEQMKAAFELTVKTFKQLDIVVNNAGILSEFDWKKCLTVNLGGCMCGTILAIDEYLPKYKSGDEGVIVNISSIAGVTPVGQVPVYSSTKHGVVALSRCFGQEEHYKATNVRVIAVCPGHMPTPLLLEKSKTAVKGEYVGRFVTGHFPIEQTENVADCVANLIKKASNGSVWVVEDTKNPYEVTYPNLRKEP